MRVNTGYLAEETAHNLFITNRVRDIAEAVTGTRKCFQPDKSEAGFCNGLAHGTGYKTVVLSVDQQYGEFCVADSCFRAGLPDRKAAKNPGAKAGKRTAQQGRDMLLPGHLHNDIQRIIVGRICQNAAYIFGKIQIRSHQHGSRTHGKTGQDNGGMATESVICPLDPAQYIPALENSKTDGSTVAASMRPLVDHQGVETHFPGEGMASRTIPVGMAPVAVKQDLQWGTVLNVVIAAIKRESVKGSDRNLLKGNPGHDSCDAADVLSGCGILFALHGRIGVCPIVLRRIEGYGIGVAGTRKD